MAEKKNKNVNFAHKVKEFLHPHNVTWMSKDNTKKETVKVLAVVAVVAVSMIAADTVIGFALGLLF